MFFMQCLCLSEHDFKDHLYEHCLVRQALKIVSDAALVLVTATNANKQHMFRFKRRRPLKGHKVHSGMRLGWLDGTTKHTTFTRVNSAL